MEKEKIFSHGDDQDYSQELEQDGDLSNLYDGDVQAVEMEESFLPQDNNQPIGYLLRLNRERLGYDLEHVARVLCVRVRFVGLIEEGNFAEIPYGDAYIIPFIRSYAEYLGIENVDEICNASRKELLHFYPSLKVLQDEYKDKSSAYRAMSDPHSEVSVWHDARSKISKKDYKAKFWAGMLVLVIVFTGVIGWKFYQFRQEQTEKAIVVENSKRALAQSPVSTELTLTQSGSTAKVEIRALGGGVDLYIFSKDRGIVYDGLLVEGRTLTLPKIDNMKLAMNPVPNAVLLINDKMVPMGYLNNTNDLDTIISNFVVSASPESAISN